MRAEDLGDFYRLPADSRDLNYDKYFVEGTPDLTKYREYNSSNTIILDIEQTKKKLIEVDLVRHELFGEEINYYLPR